MTAAERFRATVAPALARSRTIRELLAAPGVLAEAGALHARVCGSAPALLVADGNTWEAAGRAVAGAFAEAGIVHRSLILPARPRPKPSVEAAAAILAALGDAVPVAVGSGVLNDLVKYAAFRAGRLYWVAATAASMDGYASAGAPLSEAGFKKTIACLPPVAILADLDVIGRAPPEMSGWGYGDLAGKVPAGGDWILADALGLEPVDDVAFPMVQANLRDWLSDPGGVAAGRAEAVAGLFAGLTLAGLAMEAHGTSRPASGAEHQIAHLWEMEGLSQGGERVSHGACVAVGTLAALGLYDWLLARDLTSLDPAGIAAAAPDLTAKRAAIAAALPPEIAARAVEETAAKHVGGEALAARLARLRDAWPALSARLRAHLLTRAEMAGLLARAGAPVSAAAIGVTDAHLRATILAARFIRSRYTILDLLDETGLLLPALDAVVGAPERSPA